MCTPGSVAATVILLSGLACVIFAQRSPERRDAGAVLESVRQTYTDLSGYYLERLVTVVETPADATPQAIVDLTLVIASADAGSSPDGSRLLPINLDRFRLGTRTSHGEQVQVCDGRKCWSYASARNEYMTGARFRDVNSSVGGSMLLGFHMFAFSMLDRKSVV